MKEEQLKQAETRVREEFNRWAAAGRGEEMQEEHAAIVAGMLAQMEFAPNDKILDVGCGSGWLAAILADKVPQGQVVGMDVADEMVRRARQRYAERANLMFIVAGVEDIPWDENFFNKIVSVESAYYWPDPMQGCREMFRVLRPGGEARLLINLYKDNVYSHQWRDKLAVATHLFSGDEWCELFRQAGFSETRHSRVPDPRPVPEGCESRWFKSADQMRRFREEGALLVWARKAPMPGWK
ncbi:MAG TPA: class I SAM-dependent methyltransferase [Candidatus Xenobia bacterium]|nr:class I SAM-dependent methyltransferase [Candidatus Xenobia bacterium]